MKHLSAPARVRSLRVAVMAVAAMAATPVAVNASNATLGAKVHTWARTTGIDAHSVALAARAHHPRRMTFSATRFRIDALHAIAAVRRQHPSSANGRRAQNLALVGFRSYAQAGARWAQSGRARLAGHPAAAHDAAVRAARYARAGNRALVSAGSMLP
ncbi:MAG: hypothetical protein U0Y82_09350 [Thermoleophilia bacterium]